MNDLSRYDHNDLNKEGQVDQGKVKKRNDSPGYIRNEAQTKKRQKRKWLCSVKPVRYVYLSSHPRAHARSMSMYVCTVKWPTRNQQTGLGR